jgi:hypothetical protein
MGPTVVCVVDAVFSVAKNLANPKSEISENKKKLRTKSPPLVSKTHPTIHFLHSNPCEQFLPKT